MHPLLKKILDPPLRVAIVFNSFSSQIAGGFYPFESVLCSTSGSGL